MKEKIMLNFKHKEMSGSLFQNDKKNNDKAPAMKGKCTINNQEYFISAWSNLAKDGKKYLSLMLKMAEQK